MIAYLSRQIGEMSMRQGTRAGNATHFAHEVDTDSNAG